MAAKKQANGKESKSKLWQRTPTPNLIRYVPSGTYYLRARFKSEPVRESLETSNYRVAIVKLDERLKELRAASYGDGPATLLDAVKQVRASVERDPSLKQNTKRSYLEELDSLEPRGNASVPEGPISRLTESEMSAWWQRTAKNYAPQRANHLLMFVRRALAIGKKFGVVKGDPAGGLKRIKIPRTHLKFLTGEEFRSLVASIRAQRKANSEQAANWIEFMAYSGMRPAEIDALKWSDIDQPAGVLIVRGGTEGTKNREARRVPIIPPMAELLGRMKRGHKNEAVFPIGKPRDALRNACERIGLPRLRIYDLRHQFASMCNASGVDVPTFSRWLGHKDGGALAMRVYVHPHEEHGKKQAAKVTFQ